jgi:hypothetical protein
MKVYVLYQDWGWDGCSVPVKVTTSKMEAKLWEKEDEVNSYKEFKIKKGEEE